MPRSITKVINEVASVWCDILMALLIAALLFSGVAVWLLLYLVFR